MAPDLKNPAAAKPAAWLIVACLLAVYIVWGTTYFAIKVAIEGFAPFFLGGTRVVGAGVLLLGWQAVRGAPAPTAKQWRGAALVGLLLLVVGNGGVSVAEHWVSSGATVALISVMPLATVLWSGAFGQGRRGAAGGPVRSRPLDHPPRPTGFGAEMLTAGLMGLVVSAALGEHWSIPHAPRIWWAWGYLVVFGSLIAFSAYRFVVERVSPSLASTYAYVNPPVGLVVGWWLGKETFSANVLLGLPVVLVAVGWHAWIQTRDAPLAPPKVPLDPAPCLPSQVRSKP